MKKAKFVVLAATLFAVTVALAQGPDTIWTKQFGGEQEDQGRAVARADGGECYFAGYTYSSGSGLSDMLLVKLDAEGDTAWTKTVGGTQNDGAYSAVFTPEGTMFAGYTESEGAGGKDFYVVAVNPEGETTRTRTYGGAQDDVAYSASQSIDAVVLAGYTESYGSGQKDMWFTRIGPDGESLWTRAYGSSGDDVAYGVVGTHTGEIVAVGHRGGNLHLLKLDMEGNRMWEKTIGGSNDDIGYDIIQTMDDAYAVAGMTKSFCNGISDVWVLKFNTEGETLWTRSLGGEGAEEGYSIFETQEGGMIIAGMSIAATDGDTGAFIARLDAQGTVMWSHVYGEDGVPEIAYSIIQGDDENFTFGGVKCGVSDDAWLVRILPVPSSIVAPGPDQMFLADRVVPNPFITHTSISYQLSHPGRIRLAVYDMLGQEVTSLASGSREAGSYEAVWNGTDALGNEVASGLYFIRLEAGDQASTTKVLLGR
ncbi:MAG: T9SS type A sorting domain-containing protein [candidate division WOR-3 bacterium]|nr:MAG: T9SS type A sorting domain-containing protein [candidate division WOR-3 bacterium]